MKKQRITIDASIIINGDHSKAILVAAKIKKILKKLDYSKYAAFHVKFEDMSDGSGY
jgi:hypothetical protein